MLQNAYFLAKIGADTAENEQHFAEILPTDALWRRDVAPRRRGPGVRGFPLTEAVLQDLQRLDEDEAELRRDFKE